VALPSWIYARDPLGTSPSGWIVNRLLVTPTGVSKALLKAADMVIVDMNGAPLAGQEEGDE